MQGIDRSIEENYGVDVRNIIPFKDTYLINTSKGRKVLKKMVFSPGRILFIHGAKEHLAHNGFTNVDRYLCTPKEEPYFVFDNSNYVITEFIEGRECNFDNDRDVSEAAILLASLHKASEGYTPANDSKTQNELGKLPEYFGKRLEDIKKLKKQANKGKSRFDHMFLEYVDYFYRIGENAIARLGAAGYSELVGEAREKGCLCHHDFTHHNIICNESGMHVANFDYCCFELKIYDIANLIRRKMRKCDWDIQKAEIIINGYTSIVPLSNVEFEVMKLLLQFPQKFWRVVNRYYNSRRSWSERSYVSRLQEVVDEIGQHTKFIENYAILMQNGT